MLESKPRRNTQIRHWYMPTVQVQYVVQNSSSEQEETSIAVGQKTTNVLIHPTKKQLTEPDMRAIRELTYIRLEQQYNIPRKAVSDFVILSFNYLGAMSEAQYFAEPAVSHQQGL